MPLDARLMLIASFVRPGSKVADVGCDHGHLMAHLLTEGICPAGIACDVREGPLSRAQALARSLKLANMDCRLGNGLQVIRPGEVQDIVIAGMGGELIAEIMKQWPSGRDASLRFILQPMTRPERLRDYLYRNGFAILREQAVESKDHCYPVMVTAYTGQTVEPTTRMLWLGGMDNLDEGDNALYRKRLLERMEHKLQGLKSSGIPNEQSIRDCEHLIRQLRQEETI